MKLVRSASPEVARSIASTGALACWGSVLSLACVAGVVGLLFVLAVRVILSARAAVWLGVPIVIALTIYLLWRGTSARLNWVLAACADRVYIRLFVWRGRGRRKANELDAIMLEGSEIASMSIRTVEVFLYGPKPKIVQSLVIEPAQAVAEDVFSYIRPLLCGLKPTPCCIRPIDPSKQMLVGNEERALTIEWKWCRPALRVFLQQVAQQCPSVVIAPEERSELDLNGIWHGISLNLDQQKRQLLVRAMRLGFACECKRLLSRYKYISFQKAAAFLAEIEREKAEAGRSVVQQ